MKRANTIFGVNWFNRKNLTKPARHVFLSAAQYELVLQQKCDCHHNAVFADFAIRHDNFLIRNARATDALRCLGCARNTAFQCIVK